MLPIGQLDGGHICHALFPNHAKMIGKIALVMVAMGMFLWLGWLVWAVMLFLMGATQGLRVPPSDLSSTRKNSRFYRLDRFWT